MYHIQGKKWEKNPTLIRFPAFKKSQYEQSENEDM